MRIMYMKFSRRWKTTSIFRGNFESKFFSFKKKKTWKRAAKNEISQFPSHEWFKSGFEHKKKTASPQTKYFQKQFAIIVVSKILTRFFAFVNVYIFECFCCALIFTNIFTNFVAVHVDGLNVDLLHLLFRFELNKPKIIIPDKLM